MVVLVTLFAGIAYYLFCHPGLLAVYGNVSLSEILGLGLVHVLLLLINGLLLKFSAEKFSLQLFPWEWFGLSVVTAMGNYLTPFSGGMLLRATYMKRRHGFQFSKFATILGANYLIYFWVISLVGVGVTAWAWTAASVKVLLIFFLVVWVLISLLAILPVVKLSGSHWFIVCANVMFEGWELMKSDSGLLIRMVLLALANIILNAASFWFACHALGFSVSFMAAAIVSLVAVFSVVIKLTPANLGVYEAMVCFTAPLVGLTVGEGLIAAILLRGVAIVPVFLLGPCFSYMLTREMLSVSVTATTSVDSN